MNRHWLKALLFGVALAASQANATPLKEGVYTGLMTCGPRVADPSWPGWSEPLQITVSNGKAEWKRENESMLEQGPVQQSGERIDVNVTGGYKPSSGFSSHWKVLGSMTVGPSGMSGPARMIDDATQQVSRNCELRLALAPQPSSAATSAGGEQQERCMAGVCLDDDIAKYRGLNWKVKVSPRIDTRGAHQIVQQSVNEGRRKCVASVASQLSSGDAEMYCSLTEADALGADLMEFLAKRPLIICSLNERSNEFAAQGGFVRVTAKSAWDGKLRVSHLYRFYSLDDERSAVDVTERLRQKHPKLRAEVAGRLYGGRMSQGGDVTVQVTGARVEYHLISDERNYGRATEKACSTPKISVN